jgi:hypothetical protein
VALKALGTAGEASGTKFHAADPVVKKVRDLARSGASPTTKLAKFLVSTKQTNGFNYLVDLIYNGAGAVSEFDQYGHFVQSLVTLSNCVEYEAEAASTCNAHFNKEGASSSAFDAKATWLRIQEELAEKSGGTASASSAPGGYLTPSAPAEQTPEIGKGKQIGAGVSASPPRRALLNYLLGP